MRGREYRARRDLERANLLGHTVRAMNRVAPLLLFAVFATPAASAPLQPLYGVVQREKSAAIETLRKLVEIESGSRDKEGLDRIAAVLQDRLAALGGKVEVI